MIGIYKITCLPTGKFYIGSSNNILARWRSHVSQLINNKHNNPYFQKAWNKYGKNNFKFEIIEEDVLKETLLEREQWWLDETKCYETEIGFNISRIAGTAISKEMQDRVRNKKEKLLLMAKNGEPKPPAKSLIGISLRSYLSETNESYDERFTKELFEIRSEWVITLSEKADIKKEKLLEMAINGQERPIKHKDPFGDLLVSYTNKNSSAYDPTFTEHIKQLRPDWFVVRTDVENKKQQLLDIAQNGGLRPKPNSSLSHALSSYTQNRRSSYDYEFDKLIRSLRPEWFNFDRTKMIKEKLLTMAKNGENKPNVKHKLYNVLLNYCRINNGCYDEKFDKEIRHLRPDWFTKKY